jgi:protein TonB
MNSADLAFMESYLEHKPPDRSGFKLATALVIHAIALTALILGPLVFIADNTPEIPSVTTFMVAASFIPPPPPPAPPPAVVAAKRPAVPRPTASQLRDLKFAAPTVIPDEIGLEENFGFGDIGSGIPGGVEGGVPGGALGGIVGGLPEEPIKRDPPTPVRLDWRSEEATPVVKVNPVYPDLAVKARAQGVVILEVLVDQHGEPQRVKVLRSLPLLESAAVGAVRQWRWKPYMVEGQGVPFWVTVTVTFKLTDLKATG